MSEHITLTEYEKQFIKNNYSLLTEGNFQRFFDRIGTNNSPAYSFQKINTLNVLNFLEQVLHINNILHQVKAISTNLFMGISELESIVIPETVEVIGYAAFKYCEELKSVDFYRCKNLWAIGAYAFCDCTSIEKIILPHGLIKVLNDTFNGCTSLSELHIPNTVKEIEAGPFRNCNSLTTIMFGGTKEEWDKIDKDQLWFDGWINTMYGPAREIYCQGDGSVIYL